MPASTLRRDRQCLRSVGQTAIGNELTPALTGEGLMRVRRRRDVLAGVGQVKAAASAGDRSRD
jgi:hypothetical protein